MSRPSYTQLEMLLTFLEENKQLARGELRTALGKLQTKNKWEEVSTKLNAAGRVKKTGRGWAKFWADKKYALKKHVAQINATTDTETVVAPLSEIEVRFLEVIGGQDHLKEDKICGYSATASESVKHRNKRPRLSENEEVSSPQSTEDPLEPEPSSFKRLSFSLDEAAIRPRASRQRRSQSPSEREAVIANLVYSRFQQDSQERSERIAAALDNLAEAVRVSGENIAGALNHLADNVRTNI